MRPRNDTPAQGGIPWLRNSGEACIPNPRRHFVANGLRGAGLRFPIAAAQSSSRPPSSTSDSALGAVGGSYFGVGNAGKASWIRPQRPCHPAASLRRHPGQESGMARHGDGSSFFTVEDAGLTHTAQGLLSCFAVLSSAQPELPIVYASRPFCQLCTTEELLVGKGLGQALQLQASSAAELAAALDSGGMTTLLLQAANPIQATFMPVTDTSSGQLQYWIACLGDQTPAEEAVVQGAAAVQLDAAFEALEVAQESRQAAESPPTPAAFTLSSEEGRMDAGVEMVNPRFVKLFGGYSAADLHKSGWYSLLGPDTAGEVAHKMAAALSSHQAGAWSVLLYRKDGTCRWFYLYLCTLPRGHLGIAFDVTATSLKSIGTYSVGRVIGQGTYGIVKVGRDRATGELVALKLVDTRSLKHLDELQQLQDEMSVLSALRHPRIICLIGVQQVDSKICFIMEYAPGGSLKTAMDQQELRVLSEERAKQLFEQMVNAVDYCHRRRVVHRDIKPENILLDSNGDVKIADFGLAGITSPFDGNLSETCGTLEFVAPEVFTQQVTGYNGYAADMWSLGAVLFEMLHGSSPFKAPNSSAIMKAACKGVYAPLPDHISPSCKNLIAGLLRVDPNQRMTMEEVVRHPWLLGDLAATRDEGPAMEAGGGTGGRSRTSSGEYGSPNRAAGACNGTASRASTRHNSLRLVVPGSILEPAAAEHEKLSAVAEESEGEAGSSAGSQSAKDLSPQRSLTNPSHPGARALSSGSSSPAAVLRRSKSGTSTAKSGIKGRSGSLGAFEGDAP